MGKLLERQRNWIEAAVCWERAIASIDRYLLEHPSDPIALGNQLSALLELAGWYAKQERCAEAVGLYERCLVVLSELEHLRGNPDCVDGYKARRGLGLTLMRMGKKETGVAALEDLLGFLDRFPQSSRSPMIKCYRSAVLKDLAQAKGTKTFHTPSGGERQESEPDPVHEVENALEIVANTHRSPGSTAPAFNSWSDTTFPLIDELAELRRTVRIDDADALAARFCELAERLVGKYPGTTVSHLVLSQALEQKAKNAWKRNDLREVSRCWTLAIAEAARAMALDPDEPNARAKVLDLQKRLKDLRDGE
jgi:tetratricopeptide (TPR) repeat protein